MDQSGSMLSDDVAEKGYALLCMAMPQTDCKILTVSEVGSSMHAMICMSHHIAYCNTICVSQGHVFWG